MSKKIKFLLIFQAVFLVITCTTASAWAQAERRTKLLNLVNEELQEIIRLNRQVSVRNPNLLLRLAELYLEKARILKEIENEKYLSAEAEKREHINKKDIFAESTKYYVKAQKACLILLKRFPKFKGRGDVFYILAFNAKEFQRPDKAKKYFEYAVKHSNDTSATSRKSKLAVAELYYNEQKFEKAIKHYEESLREIKGRWWTKDAFNLAWCYFRNGQKAKGIGLLHKIFELSKRSEFYDMSHEVKRDLALFYVDAGRTDDAIKFYRGIGEDIATYLVKVAQHLIEMSKFSYAIKVLNEALPLSKTREQKIDIHIMLLEINEKYGTVANHLNSFNALVSMHEQSPLQGNQFELTKYHGEKYAAILQKAVLSKEAEKDQKRKKEKAGLAKSYFVGLSKLNKTNAHVYLLHIAETLYGIERFEESASYYEKSAQLARAAGDQNVFSNAQKGLMAVLAQKNISKAVLDKYLISAYKSKLTQDPKGEDAKKIYQRLFLEYFDKNEIGEAEKIFWDFKANFPAESKTQEAMVAKLADVFLAKRDFAKYDFYFQKIKKGEIEVNNEIKQKMLIDLTAFDFEKAEKANQSGNKVLALKYYYSIYKNPEKREESKKIAAYNIAILYTEMGHVENIYKWASSALDLMSPSDVKHFETSLVQLGEKLFAFGAPEMAGEIDKKIYFKMCNGKFDKKDAVFRNAFILKVASNKFQEAQDIIESGTKCGIEGESMNFARYELIDELIAHDNLTWAKKHIDNIIEEKIVGPKLAILLERFAEALRDKKEIDLARTYIRFIPRLFGANVNVKTLPIEVLDVFVRFHLAELDKKANSLATPPLSFPEGQFNNQIKAKFKGLEELTTKAGEILKMGSAKGVVRTFKILSDAYLDLAHEIANFTPPEKDANYVLEFKSNLGKIVKQLEAKASTFSQDAANSILKNNILSPYNYEFLSQAPQPLRLRYVAVRRPVLMDRGGR